MKYVVVVCLCCLCVILIVLAVSTRTLVDSDSVRITQNGHRFAVYDLLGGDVYSLVYTRQGRTDGPESPQMMIETDTIKISRIAGGFETSSVGRVYRITRKLGVLEWLRK